VTDNMEGFVYVVAAIVFIFTVGFTIEHFVDKSAKKEALEKFIKGDKWNDRQN